MPYVDERVVLEFYLAQLEEEKIEFLKGKPRYRDLITEEINLLLIEKDMHGRIGIAKNLWKLLFEAAMIYIDPDKRGYDDLFAFFDEYVDFEELIFASDAFYRDHTLHCLWVYFLGEYIRKSPEFKDLVYEFEYQELPAELTKLDSAIRKSRHRELFSGYLYVKDTLHTQKNNQDAIWCIAAITHDLGYPMKKIGQINKSIQKILPYFHVKQYDTFNFSYTDVQQSYINGFLELMSYGIQTSWFLDDVVEGVEIFKDDGETVKVNDAALDALSESEYEKVRKAMPGASIELKTNFNLRQNLATDFEQYEHGLMSAFLLVKTVYSLSAFKFSYSDFRNIATGDVDVAKLFSIREILSAIANHTSAKFQITSIRDTSDFLVLIDELEEFSRISRANQNRQYIEELCQTKLSFVDGWFEIDFLFDNKEVEGLDPGFAFKGRCRRFLELFDIHNLDARLKIRLKCIDQISNRHKTYCLEIARKYANILIDDQEQHIPSYLGSRTFYTKEEYAN